MSFTLTKLAAVSAAPLAVPEVPTPAIVEDNHTGLEIEAAAVDASPTIVTRSFSDAFELTPPFHKSTTVRPFGVVGWSHFTHAESDLSPAPDGKTCAASGSVARVAPSEMAIEALATPRGPRANENVEAVGGKAANSVSLPEKKKVVSVGPAAVEGEGAQPTDADTRDAPAAQLAQVSAAPP